jgi:Fe-S cluster assembly protein SufD
VIQDHVSIGSGAAFTNAVTELLVGADARLEFVLLQREDDLAFHVSGLFVRVARDAALTSHVLSLGGRLVRNDLSALLSEPGAECTLRGLFLGTGDRVVDNHTLVDHAVPHGTSRELYKGVLGGRSRGVFRGRVIVRPHAQKTNATQSNPNLLLSDAAEIDTKPQLEIHADDVRCSHGSSIGQVDPEALFYLRARGLGERQARDLLTRGFAQEIATALPSAPLAERVSELLLERLAEGEEAPR